MGSYYAGKDPEHYTNNNPYVPINVWTKENWAVYHALVTYFRYINRGNLNNETLMYYNKGLRFMDRTNQTRVENLNKKIETIKQYIELRLMDFVELFRLFKKGDLEAIGY